MPLIMPPRPVALRVDGTSERKGIDESRDETAACGQGRCMSELNIWMLW
jgi:hypothetical protein